MGSSKKDLCECGNKKDSRAKRCSICANKSTPVGSPRKKSVTDDFLVAVETSSTYQEVAEKTGLNRKTVSLIIRENDINVSHFQRGRYRPTTPEHILVKHDRCRNNGIVKSLILREKLIEYVCECGQEPEWNGKPLTLQLDHINGDYQDDRLENLRFLCPNCHTQTDTFCGAKTKGLPKRRKE
jgi:hypothetical protein